mgnify:FL=1
MHFVQAKGILSKNNGMNIYRGCSHGCIYCDSRSKCYGFTHAFEDIEVKENAPELLEKIEGIFRNMAEVSLLGSFEEAVAVVEFVKENPVDMVFTDIVMPDISGISLASELHKLKNPPAVVLMSSIPGFSLEAWKIQAFGFIEKPYTRAQVVKMVDLYQAGRRGLE